MKNKHDKQLINNPIFRKEIDDLKSDYLNLRKAFNCYKHLLSQGNSNINQLREETNLLMKDILATEKTYGLFNKFTIMKFSLLKTTYQANDRLNTGTYNRL